MNVLRSTPSVDAAESDCSPEPRTNRNSSGWISDVTIRTRSSAKRIRSRRQTIRTARASDRQERSGTRTATTSAIAALIGRAPDNTRIMARLAVRRAASPRRGSSSPCSA